MITSEVCIGKYTGDGVATEFAIPFKYRLNNDLTAQILVMTYDGTDIKYLEQGTDYAVEQYDYEDVEDQDDDSPSGGNLLGKLVFETAPAVGLKIAVLRNIPLVQRTDWVNGENIDMEAMEGEFDQLVMCLQQLQERSTRTTTLSIFSDTDPQSIVEMIENYSVAAQTAANQAITKANEASSSASDASSAANVAESMATSASNSANASSSSATSASGNAALAKKWAIGDPSEPTEHSSKYWAEQAASTMAGLSDAKITIQKNGTEVESFTLNQSSAETINITVPTKVSDLSNDSGFITGIDSSAVTTALGYTPVNPSSLASVATSGSYTDLENTPTIPAAQVNSDWSADSGVAQILNKPTIPVVNNSTIQFTQGGVSKGSFTLNQSAGATIALDAGGSGSSGITNDATGTDSLTILGNPTQYEQAINIGVQSYAKGNYATALGGYDPEYGECQADDYGVSIGASAQGGVGSTTVGYASTDGGSGNTLVGRETFIDEYVTNSVAIGREAQVTGEGTNVTNAVQIGAGINQTSNTVQMGDYPTFNLSTGLIPDARISSNIARTSALPSITIQKVNSLPASPSSSILYCIPES